MRTTYLVRARHDDGSKSDWEFRAYGTAKEKCESLKNDADTYGIEKLEIITVTKETIESYDIATERK